MLSKYSYKNCVFPNDVLGNNNIISASIDSFIKYIMNLKTNIYINSILKYYFASILNLFNWRNICLRYYFYILIYINPKKSKINWINKKNLFLLLNQIVNIITKWFFYKISWININYSNIYNRIFLSYGGNSF